MPAPLAVSVKVEGLAELSEAFAELPASTGAGVLRRIMTARLIPMAIMAAGLAARLTGHLQFSIGVSNKLSRRQSQLNVKADPDDIEMFMGPAALPQATLEEFGGPHNHARPFMRPAWDALKDGLLPGLAGDLWQAILATMMRRIAKAERDAAKTGP